MAYTMPILLKYSIFTLVAQAVSIAGWWYYIHKSSNPLVA